MIGAITAGLFSTGAAAGGATSYESIATVTVGAGSQSSITFSSIPSTYSNLQIRWIGRGTFSAADVGQKIIFNSDTGANYSNHLMRGNGTSALADNAASQTSINFVSRIAAASATSGMFGVGVMDILDYANSNKYKVVRSLGGVDENGSGEIRFNSGAWLSTSAITSMTFSITDGGNYAQYTHFALYGIKG